MVDERICFKMEERNGCPQGRKLDFDDEKAFNL